MNLESAARARGAYMFKYARWPQLRALLMLRTRDTGTGEEEEEEEEHALARSAAPRKKRGREKKERELNHLSLASGRDTVLSIKIIYI